MNSPIAQYIQDQRESMEDAVAAALADHALRSKAGDCTCVPLGAAFALHQSSAVMNALLALFNVDETETVADPIDTLNAAIRALPAPPESVWNTGEPLGDTRGWVLIRDHGNDASVISGVEDSIRLRGVLEAAVGRIITGEYES